MTGPRFIKLTNSRRTHITQTSSTLHYSSPRPTISKRNCGHAGLARSDRGNIDRESHGDLRVRIGLCFLLIHHIQPCTYARFIARENSACRHIKATSPEPPPRCSSYPHLAPAPYVRPPSSSPPDCTLTLSLAVSSRVPARWLRVLSSHRN